MCGLASHRMSRGEPALTKVSRISRWAGFLVPVLSLPSEKVPAPPRPNWILLSGSRIRSLRKRSIASERRSAGSPRSMSRGLRPASARARAAKRPAQPAPTTTGRPLGAFGTGWGMKEPRRQPCGCASGCARRRGRPLPVRVGSLSARLVKLKIKWTSRFLRVSIDLRWSSMALIWESSHRRARLTARLPIARQAASSPASSSDAWTWVISIIEVSLDARKRPPGVPDGPNAFDYRLRGYRLLAARIPEIQAHARLKPPQSASMSSASPQM
mgnify:CR=1 FL=1